MSAVSEFLRGSITKSHEAIGNGSKGDFVGINTADGKITKMTIDSYLNAFNEGTTAYSKCCKLSSDKALVAFYYSIPKVMAVDIKGNSSSYGTPVDLATSGTAKRAISACYVEDDKAVVTFYGTVGTSKTWARVCTVTGGTDIVLGDGAEVNASNSEWVESCLIDNNKILIAYQDEGALSYGTAIVGTISGTTISFGTEVQFNTSITYDIRVCKLDTDKALICYRDSDTTTNAIVCTVSGTTISFGTETTITTEPSNSPTCVQVGTNKAFIAVYISGTGYIRSEGIVCTVSGTTPSFGKSYAFGFGYADNQNMRACRIEDNKVFLTWMDQVENDYACATVASISGTVITFGPRVVYNPDSTNYNDCCLISTDKVFLVYESTVGSDPTGQTASCNIFNNTVQVGKFLFGGIVADDFTDGNRVNVVKAGAVKGISNMSFNHLYILTQQRDRIYTRKTLDSTTSFNDRIAARDISSDSRIVLQNRVYLKA